jgi:hypothetical protein
MFGGGRGFVHGERTDGLGKWREGLVEGLEGKRRARQIEAARFG